MRSARAASRIAVDLSREIPAIDTPENRAIEMGEPGETRCGVDRKRVRCFKGASSLEAYNCGIVDFFMSGKE
jgi:hypothetical protein